MPAPMILHGMEPTDAGMLAYLLAWLPFAAALPAAWVLYRCTRRRTPPRRAADTPSRWWFNDEPV